MDIITYNIKLPKELWEKFKSKHKEANSLNSAIVELIEKDLKEK